MAETKKLAIVAIGASAGGLDALKQLLRALPTDADIGFIILQHLDPNQPSMLTEILSRFTSMPVEEARDGQRIAPSHVYVGPPNKVVTVSEGAIRLVEVSDPRGKRYPIDALFKSIAEDQRERAVGVILSGTGTDGTAGIAAIKHHGGFVIVEDPDTAEFDGMPQSAIDTGLVDIILTPSEIPASLLKILHHPYILGDRVALADAEPEDLLAVLALLRVRSQFDFRAYKTTTIIRRIQRRMGLAGIEEFGVYIDFLRKSPGEIEQLRKDVLISVTSLFRDPDVFELLEKKVIPKIVADSGPDEPLRVWVPGCATGEEVYSLAMLFRERMMKDGATGGLRVFATDVDEAALAVARAATYPENSIVSVVSEARIKQFLIPEGEHRFRVAKSLREDIVFAPHDLLTDPPFSKMDLISCRNLLIYLQPAAQKRVISMFHGALKPGGILLLGSAESVGEDSGFEPISSKWRIYRRVGPARTFDFAGTYTPPAPRASVTPGQGRIEPKPVAPGTPNLGKIARASLLDDYAPASVLVNDKHEILYIHGDVGRYLDLPRGEPTLDIMMMLREGLRAPVRIALNKAKREKRVVRVERIRVNRDGGLVAVNVVVKPVHAPAIADGLAIVTFQDTIEKPATKPAVGAKTPRHERQDTLVRDLEDELATTKLELQNTIEAYEATNEEMKASNEEMMSMNEEFRSTNEELETSKEELQSLNEELGSVNNELKEKVLTLESTTNDLTNLLASTDVATVFLDRDFKIRRYTPATRKLLNLLPSDLGRPLADIALKFKDEALLEDGAQVLADLAPIEKDVRSIEGRWFRRRILPYRTSDDRIEGTVVTFHDVDSQKRTEQALRAAKRYAEGIIATIREPLLVLDADLRVHSANQAFYKHFGATPSTTERQYLTELGNGQWNIPELGTLLARLLPNDEPVHDFEVDHEFEGLGRRVIALNARRLEVAKEDGGGSEMLILLALEDVTESKAVPRQDARLKLELERGVRERTRELTEANRILREANESLDSFSWVVGHDLKEPVRAVENILTVIDEDHATDLPDETRELVDQARRENRRLAQLIVGLLEFSRAARVERGELLVVSLREALGSPDCVTRYERVSESRNAHIEGPDPDVEVLASPANLAQILGNLILNAVKHNPKAHPKVMVRAFPAQDPGFIEIVVADNGPGFPAAIRAGFDADGDTTHGGGFGLAIARRGVRRLGGEMWLSESRSGGAAVHFTLAAAPKQNGA